jgi:hypothetical protein
MARIQWIAQVACEYGGPVLIADAADYEKWAGTLAYPLEARRVLHYWGQFSAELPEPWSQDGGHVWREADDFDALVRDRDALLNAVKATFAGATVTRDDTGGADVRLADGRRMTIELWPKSAYDEACESEDPAWLHDYSTPSGRRGRGLFWDKQGSGDFFVGATEARDEVLLLRTWVDDDALQDTAKAWVDTDPPDEIRGEGIELVVAEAPLVVAYSPHTWLGVLGPERLAELTAPADPDDVRARMQAAYRSLIAIPAGAPVQMLSTEENDDIAAVLHAQTGTYDVSVGFYDPEVPDGAPGWSCTWCRLVRRA